MGFNSAFKALSDVLKSTVNVARLEVNDIGVH